MNCDECKEQVFELIEREALDPEGVRELLERCPECAAAFADMKAALAAAGELPLESPRAAVDAAILRAAAARRPRVVSIAGRRMQPFPWAVAATALLAVGIGVWSIPRDVDEAPVASHESAVEGSYDEDDGVTADLAEELAAAELEEPEPSVAQKTAGRPAKPAAKKARARRAKERSRSEVARAPASQPASQPAAPSVAGGLAANDAQSLRESAPTEAKLAMADEEASVSSEECEEKAEELNRRKRDAKRGDADAEGVLAVGRCYQSAGDAAKAREWLRRAAQHPTTKSRALEALRALGPE